jgi:hypothetical protein
VVVLVAAGALGWAGTALGLPPFSTASPQTLASAGGARHVVFSYAVGCHATYDRLVVRSAPGRPNAKVRKVAQVHEDGSGHLVPLLGQARLLVVLQVARAHNASGTASLIPAARTPLCPNLRQVKVSGDFEGYVSFGLGLRHQAGFRVWPASATKFVIDVAH